MDARSPRRLPASRPQPLGARRGVRGSCRGSTGAPWPLLYRVVCLCRLLVLCAPCSVSQSFVNKYTILVAVGRRGEEGDVEGQLQLGEEGRGCEQGRVDGWSVFFSSLQTRVSDPAREWSGCRAARVSLPVKRTRALLSKSCGRKAIAALRRRARRLRASITCGNTAGIGSGRSSSIEHMASAANTLPAAWERPGCCHKQCSWPGPPARLLLQQGKVRLRHQEKTPRQVVQGWKSFL